MIIKKYLNNIVPLFSHLFQRNIYIQLRYISMIQAQDQTKKPSEGRRKLLSLKLLRNTFNTLTWYLSTTKV